MSKKTEMGKKIADKLLPIMEQKLDSIGMSEGAFFKLIGASMATGYGMRNGGLPQPENFAALCLALGIDMNEFFSTMMPGFKNLLTVYEKKMEEIRRHEALADRLRGEMNVMLARTSRPVVDTQAQKEEV